MTLFKKIILAHIDDILNILIQKYIIHNKRLKIRENVIVFGVRIPLLTIFSLRIPLLTLIGLRVPNGKGQGQLACQKEWKKCEEENG